MWVWVSEFGVGLDRGELPDDLALVVVGRVLPGGQLAVEHFEVLDAVGQALPVQAGSEPG